jgi:endonuclease YncB( thermonuclease family)
MNHTRSSVVLTVLLVAAGALGALGVLCSAPATGWVHDRLVLAPPVTDVERERARVVGVVDGDTIKVRLRSGRRVHVRLLGIDSPEISDRSECHGPEAAAAAKRMLPRATRVRLTSDPTQALEDRYGRLLRYVAKGRTDVNRRLVARGHARVYVYGGKPFQRTRSYRKAQDHARSQDLGLWGVC